jgi:isochorismate hydrolase
MPTLTPIPDYPMPAAAELPANTVTWRPDPKRAVLLIHDMQQYFLRPYAVGASPRRELVGNIAALRARSAALGVPVAYTAQPGSMTASQRGLLADFWGPGMRVDPEDRQVIDPLRPEPDDWRFTKWRYSAFFRSALLTTMEANGRDQLIVCGVYASVGVLTTAMDAFSHDIQTFLPADAVADFSAEQHRQTLRDAAGRCAMVLPTGRLIEELGRTPAVASRSRAAR